MTSTTIGDPSSSASYYNAFVTVLATAGVSQVASITASNNLSWYAVGTFAPSPDTLSVFSNIGLSADTVGIYGLDGTKIAAGTGTASSHSPGE